LSTIFAGESIIDLTSSDKRNGFNLLHSKLLNKSLIDRQPVANSDPKVTKIHTPDALSPKKRPKITHSVSSPHVKISNENDFENLSKKQNLSNSQDDYENSQSSEPLGYYINIGTTSSRLFEVADKHTLKELSVTSYDICNPEDTGYLDGIISHVKTLLLPKIEGHPNFCGKSLLTVTLQTFLINMKILRYKRTLLGNFTKKPIFTLTYSQKSKQLIT